MPNQALPDARGAPGSDAAKGERNYRHGFYTSEAIAERRAMRALIHKQVG